MTLVGRQLLLALPSSDLVLRMLIQAVPQAEVSGLFPIFILSYPKHDGLTVREDASWRPKTFQGHFEFQDAKVADACTNVSSLQPSSFIKGRQFGLTFKTGKDN